MKSRAIGYGLLGAITLGFAYVLSSRALGTVASETGPTVCGPAVFGRVSPLPAPECAPHLQNVTSFAGVALIIGVFLVMMALASTVRTGRRVAPYRY